MLNLLTIVYGDNHVDLFKRTCVFSLGMTKNKAALEAQETCWQVYTDEKHMKELETLLTAKFPKTKVRVINFDECRDYIDYTQSAFLITLADCLKNDAPLLFAPPDIFFGDGSVSGLIQSAYEKKSVAVVAHVRVTSDILSDPQFLSSCASGSLSNAKLVSFAWKHLHRCWGDAELGHPRQNQFGTGVCWQKIEDNLYSVVHRLPTPYLIHFDEEDHDYFKYQCGFGYFDHRWPGDILIKNGRQRYITSSDVAFMVEITEPDKNISNIPGNKDEFWQKNYHNEINKQVLVTLRGGDV